MAETVRHFQFVLFVLNRCSASNITIIYVFVIVNHQFLIYFARNLSQKYSTVI